MSRYEPLTRHLTGLREAEAPMTFRQIEDILGRPLPPSARKHQAWWANTPSHSHAKSWLGAGRRVERLDQARERLVFVRHDGSPHGMSESSAPYLNPQSNLLLEAPTLSSAAWRLITDRARDKRLSPALAAADILNEAGLARRRQLLEELAAEPRLPMGSSSVDLIREDRDGR